MYKSLTALFLVGVLYFALRAQSVNTGIDLFTDVTASAGITWKHVSGASQGRRLIEAMGGGVAFLDFDGDGRQDIFLVTGGETPNGHSATPPRNALYRNLGNGRFEDVAEKAGVSQIGFYGMGVSVADYDNDGFPDLYITGYPRSALFHNNGDGTFTDVTDTAGVSNNGKWAAGAAWIDFDRDGKLDLFVSNYAKLSDGKSPHCEYKGEPTYCAQTAYEGDTPTLYRNNGDGTFRDVTEAAGLARLSGRALGALSIDVNGDGWTDLFVARDASPNLLLMNQRNGTFEDKGDEAEIALTLDGNARAGMGVDAADTKGDGRPDFVVTNFSDEHHALFLNRGRFPFEERTTESGLASLTRRFVGWGAQFLDFNNDGNPDLMIVTGHINRVIEKTRRDVSYLEPPLLLESSGTGIFRDVGNQAGPVFNTGYAARGLATGDIDNDGGIDCIFTRLDESPVLLQNNVPQGNAWVGLELEGTRSNRDAIGAKATVEVSGRKLTRWVTSGGSYLSSHDKRMLFGLGKAKAGLVSVEIQWPSGQVQRVSNLAVGKYHKIQETRSALHQ